MRMLLATLRKYTMLRRFRREESGASLAETIIILPVMIVFLAGILEFGAFLFTKLEVETGLRDASRYLARCSQQPGFKCATLTDGEAIAKNIALYGNPAGTGSKRVVDWSAGDITFTVETIPSGTKVVAETSFSYAGSPVLGFLGVGASLPIATFHEDRYVGW